MGLDFGYSFVTRNQKIKTDFRDFYRLGLWYSESTRNLERYNPFERRDVDGIVTLTASVPQ